MGSSVIDANDAILAGRAKAEAAMRQFKQDWNGPLLLKMVKVKWATMPEADKLRLKAENPEAYKKLISYFETS